MKKHAAAVGVDVDAVVVRPDFAGDELFEGFGGVAGGQSRSEDDAE